MKQNDAVFQAVCEIFGVDSFSQAVVLSDAERKTVIAAVVDGLLDGTVDFSDEAKIKYDTPTKVKSYTTGMVSNHLRKDKRLNGGEKYEIKNPGSRAGSGDEQLKALKALRSRLTEAGDKAQIDEAIKNRTEALKAESSKPVEIDLEALPAQFHHLVK